MFLLTLGFLLPGAVYADSYSVDRVVVEGTRRVDPRVIRSVLKASAEAPVSAETIDADLAAIFQQGRFDDVSAEVTDRHGEKLLVYRVVERPLVRKVVFDGNEEIDNSTLTPLVLIKVPEIYNPKKARDSIEAIKAAYADEGYNLASVTPKLEVNADNEATLTFAIVEGKRVLIDTIHFEGNTVFSARQLRKVMATEERWWLSFLTDRGVYKEEILQDDLLGIQDVYFDKGYIQVRVKQPVVKSIKDGRYLDILIEISEGEQFSVGQLDIQGDLIEEKGVLLDLGRLKTGDVFNRSLLRESMQLLNSYYADRGYAYVNVTPLTKVDPTARTISITYNVERGPEVFIGRINIHGNTKTLDKVVRRELQLAEGERFSAAALTSSRRSINNLNFFEEVNLNTNTGNDAATMDIDIDVKPKPTGTFSLGVGYSTVDKLLFQGSVSQNNFLGRGLRLNLSGSLGGSSTTYQLGILDPYFLDTKYSLGFDLYRTEREWDEYTERKIGGDVKLGFPVAEDLRAFFIYRYEKQEIDDVSPFATTQLRAEEGQSTLSSLFGSLTYDKTDYSPDPSKGGISEVSAEFAGLGGTERFARFILDHRQFFPMKWGTVFSVHGQVGYIARVGRDIPVNERFYLGGIRTIRGFKTRNVGPRVLRENIVTDPVTGAVISTSTDFEYTGGDKEGYINLEYVFPIAREAGVKGVVFFDTGNAWNEDETYFESMRYSTGFGIRWLSPLGPLRLEWGYNLDPLEGEKSSEIEFTIGRFY